MQCLLIQSQTQTSLKFPIKNLLTGGLKRNKNIPVESFGREL